MHAFFARVTIFMGTIEAGNPLGLWRVWNDADDISQVLQMCRLLQMPARNSATSRGNGDGVVGSVMNPVKLKDSRNPSKVREDEADGRCAEMSVGWV